MSSLKDKVVLVTGASRGIGKAIALAFANQGASVVVHYNKSKDEAQEVVNSIQEQGGKAMMVGADLSRVENVDIVLQETIKHFNKLDILVNNAGVGKNEMLEQVSEESYDYIFNTNTKTVYFTIQKAVKFLPRGGKIINISSLATHQMYPAYSVYAASKAAVEQFTRHLAKELGPKGIMINAIAPGPIETDMYVTGKSENYLAAVARGIALGRIGKPNDIANVAVFLASDEANWLTGQIIDVNGGMI